MNPTQVKSTAPSANLLTKLSTRLRRPRRRVLGQTLTPTPVAPPPDPLLEIGAQLQAKRQQAGKTLAQISAETLVSTRILAAIEEGRTEALPEPVYVKGMIRRYADALGLEGQAMAARFAAQPPTTPQSPTTAPGTEATASTTQTPIQRPTRSGLKFHPIYLYLLYVGVLGAACGGLYMLSQDSGLTTTQPSISSAPAAPDVNPAASAPAVAKPASDAPQAPQASPAVAAAPKVTAAKPAATTATAPVDNNKVKASLSVKEASWMEVVADGKTLFNGTLQPGSGKTITAEKNLKIRVGNAGGVLLRVNDQPEKVMGQRGMPQDFVWEAQQPDSNAST